MGWVAPPPEASGEASEGASRLPMSKSERKRMAKKRAMESDQRDKFTGDDGKFDYSAARSSTPFGSGFGLLQSSGAAAPKSGMCPHSGMAKLQN